MSDPKILEQIRIQRLAGVGDEQIKKILRIEGFGEPEIAQALVDAAAAQAAAAAAPAPAPAPVPSVGNVSAAANIHMMPPGNLPLSPMTVPPVHKSAGGAGAILSTVFAIILILAGAGGVAYAYIQKIGPFAHLPYTEKNLITGVLGAITHINSNSYSISGALSVAPRDADAYPFNIQASNRDDMIEKYGNDYKRSQTVSLLLSTLLYNYRGKSYPTSLAAVAADTPSYRTKPDITDPVTEMPYRYSRSPDGTDFALTVTFETSDAISAIRQSGKYASSTTYINDKTVTFNKGSSSFFYMPSEPPKPYLEQISEMMRFLSPDVSGDLTASASIDWANADGEWKFNIDANGDLGDLSYKFNVDALKKNKSYFIRVNNMPAILSGQFSSVKGTWIKIDPAALAAKKGTSYSMYSSLASDIPEAEKRYKDDRAQLAAFIKTMAQIADDEGLLTLKGNPHSERVDGQVLYRYDLDINKSAVLPFYKRMVEEAAKNKSISDYDLFNDSGTVEYLQSDEFSQVFDYMRNNVNISLWVDPAGYPEKLTYTMRIVPPDTATQLKDKQVMLTFTGTLTNINKPVVVDEPADSKPIQDLISELEGNLNYSLDDARTKGRDARRVADIKQLQLALELYYDANNHYPSAISTATLVTPGYLPEIPRDPSTDASYSYAGLGAGTCTGYHLGAVLEDASTALATDLDASPKTTCSGSARDFNGSSASCGTTKSSTDRCYDVSN